jgi:hypothetical protein
VAGVALADNRGSLQTSEDEAVELRKLPDIGWAGKIVSIANITSIDEP